MWHKALWIGYSMRFELSREGLRKRFQQKHRFLIVYSLFNEKRKEKKIIACNFCIQLINIYFREFMFMWNSLVPKYNNGEACK